MSVERKPKVCLSIALILATVFCAFQAEAAQAGVARIRVSQESTPGAGDFDANILGVIESFDECGKTVAQSYAYDGAHAVSYSGTTITPQTNTSHLFTDAGVSDSRTGDSAGAALTGGSKDGRQDNVLTTYERAARAGGRVRRGARDSKGHQG